MTRSQGVTTKYGSLLCITPELEAEGVSYSKAPSPVLQQPAPAATAKQVPGSSQHDRLKAFRASKVNLSSEYPVPIQNARVHACMKCQPLP